MTFESHSTSRLRVRKSEAEFKWPLGYHYHDWRRGPGAQGLPGSHGTPRRAGPKAATQGAQTAKERVQLEFAGGRAGANGAASR